jgi:tagatose-1,6-bisphosphate aldolase
MIEPVVHRLSTESPGAFASAYERLVIDAVARLRPLGADLLKLPFPVLDSRAVPEAVALAACEALDRACGQVPWVLLGAGVDTPTFLDQVRLAGSAGAAGFLAGRGIWGSALDAGLADVERLATRLSLPDLRSCRETAERCARPLTAPRPT